MTTEPTPQQPLPQRVKQKELARIFNVSEKTIINWRNQGLPCVKTGYWVTFDLTECIQWYTDYRIGQSTKNTPLTTSSTTEEEARTRKLLAEAQLKELELFQTQRQLIRIDDATRDINRELEKVRSKLLAIPAVWGPQLLGLSSTEDAVEQLSTLVHNLMDDLSHDDYTDEDLDEGETPDGQKETETVPTNETMPEVSEDDSI